MYFNRFFETEADAKAFRKKHKYGRTLHLTEKSHLETRRDFYAEIAVALDARGEVVDPNLTPYCVAWYEK